MTAHGPGVARRSWSFEGDDLHDPDLLAVAPEMAASYGTIVDPHDDSTQYTHILVLPVIAQSVDNLCGNSKSADKMCNSRSPMSSAFMRRRMSVSKAGGMPRLVITGWVPVSAPERRACDRTEFSLSPAVEDPCPETRSRDVAG